jgi:putative ABC transport system permease protein
LSLPQTLFAGPDDVRGFYTRLLDRVRTLPGVQSAATATGVLQPLVANSGIYTIEGKPLPPAGQQIEYPVEIVSPGFFETLKIQLAAGRFFTNEDHATAPPAAIVNETFAKMAWPGQDPIGRRIRPGGDASTAPWITVVGVIKDVRRADLRRAVRPEIYSCALQRTPRTQMLIVRAAGDPTAIVPVIRREVQAMNPMLPLFATGTLDADLSETLSQPRFRAVLLAGFAVIAMLLASIGIYGVTAHAVSQRTQEVGVRMALGAQRSDVLLLMVRQHLRPALIGVAIGIAGAFALGRYIQSLVYGVGAADPLTFVVMALALLSVAFAACLLPARRATRVDALVALRNS